MLGLDLEDLLERVHGALGRADLLGEHPTTREQELDATAVVLDHLEVALDEGRDVFPAVEGAVVAPERDERVVVGGVDLEDGLVGLGGALVVEELLVVDRGDALEEADPLARGGRDADLGIEVREQLLVAARAVVDAVEALEGDEVARVDLEHGLEALHRLGHVADLVLVELADLGEHLGALGAADRAPSRGPREILTDRDEENRRCACRCARGRRPPAGDPGPRRGSSGRCPWPCSPPTAWSRGSRRPGREDRAPCPGRRPNRRGGAAPCPARATAARGGRRRTCPRAPPRWRGRA